MSVKRVKPATSADFIQLILKSMHVFINGEYPIHSTASSCQSKYAIHIKELAVMQMGCVGHREIVQSCNFLSSDTFIPHVLTCLH